RIPEQTGGIIVLPPAGRGATDGGGRRRDADGGRRGANARASQARAVSRPDWRAVAQSSGPTGPRLRPACRRHRHAPGPPLAVAVPLSCRLAAPDLGGNLFAELSGGAEAVLIRLGATGEVLERVLGRHADGAVHLVRVRADFAGRVAHVGVRHVGLRARPTL